MTHICKDFITVLVIYNNNNKNNNIQTANNYCLSDILLLFTEKSENVISLLKYILVHKLPDPQVRGGLLSVS